MIQTSIVIPSRNEQFLSKTVTDILSKHGDDIEVIVILEGYWDHTLPVDKRLIQIHHGKPLGMRKSINDAVAIAKGDFILKIDGHCMISDRMCNQLVEDWQKDTDVVIPRRKRLDPENWTLCDTNKTDVDYEYLSAPTDPNDWGGKGLNGKIWDERSKSRRGLKIDENMSFQGSCWFMKKSYFHFLELMDQDNYGIFWCEAQEIGLKAWLSGGRVLTNKNCWYAHLHKGKKYGRGYKLNEAALLKGRNKTIQWLEFKKAWHKQTIPLEWLIEKFAPVPTWHDKDGNLIVDVKNIDLK